MPPKQKSIQQALGLIATKDRERDIANWYIERFDKHGGFLGRCGVDPAKDFLVTVEGQFRLGIGYMDKTVMVAIVRIQRGICTDDGHALSAEDRLGSGLWYY